MATGHVTVTLINSSAINSIRVYSSFKRLIAATSIQICLPVRSVSQIMDKLIHRASLMSRYCHLKSAWISNELDRSVTVTWTWLGSTSPRLNCIQQAMTDVAVTWTRVVAGQQTQPKHRTCTGHLPVSALLNNSISNWQQIPVNYLLIEQPVGHWLITLG